MRVRVDAIGVNYAEILSRKGLYGWAPNLPYTLGMEATGVIEAVGQRADLGDLTDEEAAIVRYVRELLHANRVTNHAFEALRSVVGDRGIVDLTGLVGYYALVGFTLNAFEIEPAEGAEPLP